MAVVPAVFVLPMLSVPTVIVVTAIILPIIFCTAMVPTVIIPSIVMIMAIITTPVNVGYAVTVNISLINKTGTEFVVITRLHKIHRA